MTSESYAHKSGKYSPRKWQRLPGYDYGSSGAYSVTICTRGRKPFFRIPALRQILEGQWAALAQHFVGITTDVLTIMHDHVHCVVWIDAEVEGSPDLSDVIGGFKSLTSVAWIRYIKENGINASGRIWQRSFNDHVVRNDLDLREKQRYILNNPIVEEIKNEQKELQKLRSRRRSDRP